MGLSYLRSNPLGGGTDDDAFGDPGDPGAMDLSALLGPNFAHRRGLPAFGGPGGPPAAPAPPAPPTFGEPGPQGLFPAQGKLPISAPADDSPDAPPGNDLLSRFASRLGGFGTGATDQDRREALRQSLIQAGLTMASNAGTHGTAALAPALLGGFATYRGGVEQAAAGREHAAQVQAAEDDRRARLAMDKGRYADEAQLRQDALQDRRDQAQGKIEQRQARLDQHKEMLKTIGETDPKLAAKLAPLAGSDTAEIEKAYSASLKPEKPVSPKGSIQVVGRTALYLDPDDPLHPKPVYTAPRDVDPAISAMRADQQDRLKESALATDANRILHSGMDYINSHNAQVRRAKADLRAGFQSGTIPDQKAYDAALAQIPQEMEVPAGAYDSALQQARAAADSRAAARGGAVAPRLAAPPPPAPKAAARPSLDEARPMILNRLRQRMPGANEDQIQAALAKAMAAYGGQ